MRFRFELLLIGALLIGFIVSNIAFHSGSVLREISRTANTSHFRTFLEQREVKVEKHLQEGDRDDADKGAGEANIAAEEAVDDEGTPLDVAKLTGTPSALKSKSPRMLASHGFLTGDELVEAHIAEDASPPSQVHYATPPSKKDHACLEFPDIAHMWKVNYPHKSKRKKELAPHDFFNLVSGKREYDWDADNTAAGENRTVFVAPEEVLPTQEVVETAPISKPVVFPPPISFSDPKQFNMSKPFGLWKTSFRFVEGIESHHHAMVQHPDHAAEGGYDGLTAIAPTGVLKALKYPQLLLPQVPMFYTMFSGGAWVSDGNAVTCRRGYTTGGCMWEYKTTPPIGPPSMDKYTPSTDVVVALCDDWCNGYFHFTHEHLPRVALIAHLLHENPTAKITVPPKNGFVVQYMTDVFGFDKNQLVSYRKTRYAEHVVQPQPQRCGSVFTSTLFLLRKIVFGRLGLGKKVLGDNGKERPFLIVLAERKKLSRMPRNYYEVMDAIKKKYEGRSVVFQSTTGLNVTAQIALFYKADMVIGPHGANLSNLLWMRHGTYIVEFMSYPYANMCYYGTAARLGLQFGAIFHGASKGGHWNMSVAEVELHVEKAMKE